MGSETQLLQDIVQKTQSDLIVFFVLVSVVLAVVFIPLYRMMVRAKKERLDAETKREKDEAEAANIRQDKYMERERGIIQVIKDNTEVMASLKATLEKDGQATVSSLERIHSRIDNIVNAI